MPITRNLLTHRGQNCIAGEHQNLLKEVWTKLIVPSEIFTATGEDQTKKITSSWTHRSQGGFLGDSSCTVDELPILHPENLGKSLGAYHTQENSDYPTRGLNKLIKRIGIRSWNQAYRGVN